MSSTISKLLINKFDTKLTGATSKELHSVHYQKNCLVVIIKIYFSLKLKEQY